jgi:hypothetical protein
VQLEHYRGALVGYFFSDIGEYDKERAKIGGDL